MPGILISFQQVLSIITIIIVDATIATVILYLKGSPHHLKELTGPSLSALLKGIGRNRGERKRA